MSEHEFELYLRLLGKFLRLTPGQEADVADELRDHLEARLEELSRGGHILRVLYPNRRYSFHFADGGLIIGLVRERVGGSWVIVETSATRKIINLDMVAYCEIL